MSPDQLSDMARDILQRLMTREGVRQAFVFNSEGDPFWVGRRPLLPDELELLDQATTMLEDAEKNLPKPFVAHDETHRFSVAALEQDTDLYLVLLHGPAANEARLALVRQEAAELLRPLRSPSLRLAMVGA